MPHFIVECPEHLIPAEKGKDVVNRVHQVAMDSGLFEKANIKVRIVPYEHYLIAGQQQDFVHVFGYIMPGRTLEQETDLSESIGELIANLFPQVPIITVNIDTLNQPSYFKRLI